jgi:hypothetical protein
VTWLEAAGWLVGMAGFAWDSRYFWQRPRFDCVHELPPVPLSLDIRRNGRELWRVDGDITLGDDVDVKLVADELEALAGRVRKYRRATFRDYRQTSINNNMNRP